MANDDLVWARSADSQFRGRVEILTSIPGTGDVTANALLAEILELGELDRSPA